MTSKYLATATISFLEKKDDDSHTNLEWDVESSHIESRFFEKNNQLIFNLLNFELMWINKEQITAKIDLQTKSQDIQEITLCGTQHTINSVVN